MASQVRWYVEDDKAPGAASAAAPPASSAALAAAEAELGPALHVPPLGVAQTVVPTPAARRPVRRRLTPGRCLARAAWSSAWCAGSVALGLSGGGVSGILLLLGLVHGSMAFVHWRRFARVRRGAAVYEDAPAVLPATPAAIGVAASVVGALTLAVATWTTLSVLLLAGPLPFQENALAALALLATNLALWGYTGHCWRRVRRAVRARRSAASAPPRPAANAAAQIDAAGTDRWWTDHSRRV